MIETRAQYEKVHKWMRDTYTKIGKCSSCEKVCKTHWSNITGKYLRTREDWQELCPKCHKFYDLHILKAKPLPFWGHSVVISKESHEKLRTLARSQKRTLQATLELLIDQTYSEYYKPKPEEE